MNNILLIQVVAGCNRKDANSSRLTVYCIVPLLEVVKKFIQLCISMSPAFSSGSSSTVLQQIQVILCRILELPLNFFNSKSDQKSLELIAHCFLIAFHSFALFSN